MPTPIVTIEVILGRLKEITLAIDDPGVVVTEESYVDEHSWAKMFTSLDTGRQPKGVAWLWQKCLRQSKGPRVGCVQRLDRFSMEMLRPFDEVTSGHRSHKEALAKWQQLNDALNVVVSGQPQWCLGITPEDYPGSDVEHQFLQGDSDFYARQWGVGSTALKSHYVSNTLDVLFVTVPPGA
jgi:hypothetical protein